MSQLKLLNDAQARVLLWMFNVKLSNVATFPWTKNNMETFPRTIFSARESSDVFLAGGKVAVFNNSTLNVCERTRAHLSFSSTKTPVSVMIFYLVGVITVIQGNILMSPRPQQQEQTRDFYLHSWFVVPAAESCFAVTPDFSRPSAKCNAFKLFKRLNPALRMDGRWEEELHEFKNGMAFPHILISTR